MQILLNHANIKVHVEVPGNDSKHETIAKTLALFTELLGVDAPVVVAPEPLPLLPELTEPLPQPDPMPDDVSEFRTWLYRKSWPEVSKAFPGLADVGLTEGLSMSAFRIARNRPEICRDLGEQRWTHLIEYLSSIGVIRRKPKLKSTYRKYYAMAIRLLAGSE